MSGSAEVEAVRWRRMRRITFAIALGLGVLGCGAGAPAIESRPPSQSLPLPTASVERSTSSPQPPPVSVELLTGDTGCYAGGEQGTAGVLVVDPEFGTRFNGMPVMWPAGFTAVRVGSEVEVYDAAGKAIAMTGKPYYISNAAVNWGSESHELMEKVGAYPAAAACPYAWDFVDCATVTSSYCEVIPPPPSPRPEPIVLDAAHAGPVLCDALTALAAAQREQVAPLLELIADNVPRGTPDEPPPPWSAGDSAAAKELGLAITETVTAHGRPLENLQSPDLEALMAATKQTYELYDQGMTYLNRHLDALPGGDFTGISDPLAMLQDGRAALRTALDLMAETAATGSVECDVPAR